MPCSCQSAGPPDCQPRCIRPCLTEAVHGASLSSRYIFHHRSTRALTAYISMQVLLNKVRAYIRQLHLWSKHVLKLWYKGTSCNSSVLVLATELLPGASLAQHGLISQEAAQDALAALSAVHAAGMLHGDIRPENVMLLCDTARPCVRV